MLRIFMMVAVLSLNLSCTQFLGHRSFIDEMDKDTDGLFVPGDDFNVLPGDKGKAYRTDTEISGRTPANLRTRDGVARHRALRRELEQKERSLTDIEYSEYMADVPFLKDQSEKVYYLNLPYPERGSYMASRKNGSEEGYRKAGLSFYESRSIRGQEIHVGMSKNDVTSLWGRPSRVDVAGNPSRQNERWSFYNNGGVKQIFFEGGVVQGWALE
jgi:hypothetical protein